MHAEHTHIRSHATSTENFLVLFWAHHFAIDAAGIKWCRFTLKPSRCEILLVLLYFIACANAFLSGSVPATVCLRGAFLSRRRFQRANICISVVVRFLVRVHNSGRYCQTAASCRTGLSHKMCKGGDGKTGANKDLKNAQAEVSPLLRVSSSLSFDPA